MCIFNNQKILKINQVQGSKKPKKIIADNIAM